MNDDRRYTISEIARATGLSKSTLQGRRKRLGIEGTGMGYTMDEVKRMVKRPPKSRRKFDQRMVVELQRKLKNDGYL